MFFSADKRLCKKDDSMNRLVDSVKNAFDTVQIEFEEHLHAINENTSEQLIQNNHLCEMDQRLDKIENRMDEIHFMLQQLMTKAELSVDLSKDEQRVFLLLYTTENFTNPKEVATRLTMPLGVVENALDALMDKAIPVEREMIEGKVYFRMKKEFKLKQAKEEVVNIDEDVKQQYQNSLLKKFFEA